MSAAICFDWLVYLLNIHILSVRILKGKLRTTICIVAFFPIGISMGLLLFLNDKFLTDLFVIFVTVLCCITPLFTVRSIKKIKIVYLTFLHYGVSTTIVLLIRWITDVVLVSNMANIIIDVIVHVLLLVICALLSVKSIFYKAQNHIKEINNKLKILLLISIWMSNFFILLFSNYTTRYPRTITLIVAEGAAIGIVALIGILWPFIIIGNSLNTSYKNTINQLDEQIHAQVKQYEFVVQANNDIRRFRHDFENIRLGLVGHLHNSDVNGALELLDRCERAIHNDEYIFYTTGNLIADALLSEKRMNAKSISVDILFEGEIPFSGISSFDLCVILGNLLDNALEACTAIEGENRAPICISSVINNGFWTLTITNPVARKAKIKGIIIPTSKKDIINHGIGLFSIQNAILKYNGTMNLFCSDDVFTAEVILDLNEKN